jgi:predicted Kef-type K+ transport protein
MAVMALGIALILGLFAKQVNLPPLVGYLVAGFALNIFGFDASDTLQTVANLGVTLLLFTIGLKINLKDLIKVEIWGSAISHLGLWMLTVAPLAFGLSLFALSDLLNIAFTELAILVFAFSFSSTVCAIKILEDASELKLDTVIWR